MNFSALIGGYLVGDVAPRVFWNFSALIGGYIVGDIDPRFWLVFLVTACVYLVGIIPLLFLIPLVSKEKYTEKKHLEG